MLIGIENIDEEGDMISVTMLDRGSALAAITLYVTPSLARTYAKMLIDAADGLEESIRKNNGQ